MKKVIILCSALVFGLLTCHDASAVDPWKATIEISELTDQSAVKKKSAKAFEERLNALEALAGKSEVEKYTKRWFVKGKWMGNKQHPFGSRNNGKVIGHLWSPKTNLAKFKQDLREIATRISELEATNASASSSNTSSRRSSISSRSSDADSDTSYSPLMDQISDSDDFSDID